MPAQKRRAPTTQEAPSRRRSTRINASSGKKSQYFEADSDGDEDELSHAGGAAGVNGRKKAKVTKKATPRGKKTKVAKDVEEEPEEEDIYTYVAEDSGGETKKKEVEEEDSDDELDEDEEPRVTFIPHKKLRDTGGVGYEDDRLHKNTGLFLKDLKANNKRTWLKSNDAEYRRSLKDWNTFVETITEKIIAADPTIPELPIKDVIFRIYRDIRFSNDPTPYKPHYGAAFSRTGRKGPYACYYIHYEPGSCFVGGGLWHPDAGQLAKLRASIDERPGRWRRVLGDELFRKTFLPGTKGGDLEGCLKGFADNNTEGALKTKPKGFDADHRDIALLKLRNFTVAKKIPDRVFTDTNGQDQIVDIVSAMVGFISFLNNVVMPDPSLDSDSSSDEEDDNEE